MQQSFMSTIKTVYSSHAGVDMYIIVGFRSNVTSNLTIQF